MLLDGITHEKQVYSIEDAARQMSLSVIDFRLLCVERGVRTFRVKQKKYIPAFEIDRLIVELIRDETQHELKGAGDA